MFRLKSLFIGLTRSRKIPNETERPQKDANGGHRDAEDRNYRNVESTGSLQSIPARKEPVMERMLDGIRVLLVDDNPEILEMLQITFDECGAEVITATSVKDALAALEARRPHVLVSDITMPDQDGFELIAQLRRRRADRGGQIPAVALTAHARAEDHVRALESGFQLCLLKPADLDELIAAVGRLAGCIRSDLRSDQDDRCA